MVCAPCRGRPALSFDDSEPTLVRQKGLGWEPQGLMSFTTLTTRVPQPEKKKKKVNRGATNRGYTANGSAASIVVFPELHQSHLYPDSRNRKEEGSRRKGSSRSNGTMREDTPIQSIRERAPGKIRKNENAHGNRGKTPEHHNKPGAGLACAYNGSAFFR
ncbi:hypothetical protein MRX96_020991 [Rhipicephalus microplus]